jgi:hypothetical protein
MAERRKESAEINCFAHFYPLYSTFLTIEKQKLFLCTFDKTSLL